MNGAPMRVLVTGASGFVGIHTVKELIAQGHEPRAFVRSGERLLESLRRLEVAKCETSLGDVRSQRPLRDAMMGCDAVIHCAARISFSPAEDALVQEVNVRGAECVLDAAEAAGLSRRVMVSSVVALFPPTRSVVDESEEPKWPRDPYTRSKAAAERLYRERQACGEPVTMIYPGQVWGPNDPTVGEGTRTMLRWIKLGLLPRCPGGVPIVDVRDVAKALVRAVEDAGGRERYMLAGHFVTFEQLANDLAALTGRRFRTPKVAAGTMVGAGQLFDWLRAVGINAGPSREAMEITVRAVPSDDSRASQRLRVSARHLNETLTDALRSFGADGVLSPRHLGRLASTDPGTA